ncbi:MAG: hypothetical protein AB8B49_02030 [Nitratireductor sp.]
MKSSESEIELLRLIEAQEAATKPQKSDQELAREYAVMMENACMDMDEMNIEACPPDRRFYQGEREAWVYEHGNIAELVFVK